MLCRPLGLTPALTPRGDAGNGTAQPGFRGECSEAGRIQNSHRVNGAVRHADPFRVAVRGRTLPFYLLYLRIRKQQVVGAESHSGRR